MIFLIHSLEIILLLLVISLGYRVVKGYLSEYKVSSNEGCEITSQVTTIQDTCDDKMDGKSIVEAYIDDFFLPELNDFNHPLSVLKQADQVVSKTSSKDQAATLKVENTDRSISSKVIDAMMAEADLACAS